MCSVCMSTPCNSRCPNAPDPEPVAVCKSCTNDILPGDEYAVINGDCYCEDCLDNMPTSALVTLLGGEWKTASEEDIYDGYDG